MPGKESIQSPGASSAFLLRSSCHGGDNQKWFFDATGDAASADPGDRVDFVPYDYNSASPRSMPNMPTFILGSSQLA